MATKVFGIDFGTSIMKVYKKGDGVIYDAKNTIAITGGDKVIAIGDEAFEMLGKAPANIDVSFPVKNGVIADVKNMLSLFEEVFKKITETHGKISSAEFIVAVPTDVTEVERKAFYDLVAASGLKAKKIKIVEKPVAGVVGAGVDVTQPQGVMLIDIGADTTEISVLSLGGIVNSKLIPIGGNKFDELIINNARKVYNLVIGNKTAETIKKELAVALEPTEEKSIKVVGRDIVTGLPAEREVSSEFVYETIKEQIFSIIENVKAILERTPPELSSDIIEMGAYITGGSANIEGIDKLLEEETGLTIKVCSDPANTVAAGLGKIIEDPDFASLATLPRPVTYV